jgi:anti-sigma-K factor RskA
VNEDRDPADPNGQRRSEDHDEYDTLAAGWALHALEPDEEARFTAHLKGCPDCRRTAADLDAVLGELAHTVRGVEPPEGALERLRIAAGTAVRVTPVTPPAPVARTAVPDAEPDDAVGRGTGGGRSEVVVPIRSARSFRDRAVRWIAVAAAVVAVVVGGWNVALQREADQRQRLVAERDAMLADIVTGRQIAALAPPGGKQPVAYVYAHDTALMVVTDGVDRNDPKSTSLWLWGLWGDERRPLARFDVHTDGMDLHRMGTMPPGTDTAAGFAVSLEPGTATPVAPSRIVAIGAVES